MHSLSELKRCSDKARCAIVAIFPLLIAAAACGTTPQKADTTPVEPPKRTDESGETTEDSEPKVVPAVSKEACALEPHWPMFQGDPGRSGASDADPIDSPSVTWSTRVGVQTWNNNPIIVGDMVIVGSGGDVWNKPDKADGLYALHAETGELAWFAAFDADVNGAALAGCRVIAGSDDGTVRAFDPITGDEVWVQDFESKVYGQPLPIPGGVLVTTKNSGIHKIDPVAGKVVWSAPTGEIRQGASWDGESIWLATTGGKMIRFSADGALQWSGDIPGQRGVWGAPTVVVDGIVAGFVRDTTYGTPALAGFRMSGSPMWDQVDRGTRANWANVRTSPAYVDGRLYHAEAYSNELVVTDLASASVEVSISLGRCMFPQWSSPIANSEQIIVARHDGGLYAVGRNDQKTRWGIYLGNQRHTAPISDQDMTDFFSRSCSWSPDGYSLLATPAIGPTGAIFVGSDEGWLFRID